MLVLPSSQLAGTRPRFRTTRRVHSKQWPRMGIVGCLVSAAELVLCDEVRLVCSSLRSLLTTDSSTYPKLWVERLTTKTSLILLANIEIWRPQTLTTSLLVWLGINCWCSNGRTKMRIRQLDAPATSLSHPYVWRGDRSWAYISILTRRLLRCGKFLSAGRWVPVLSLARRRSAHSCTPWYVLPLLELLRRRDISGLLRETCGRLEDRVDHHSDLWSSYPFHIARNLGAH